MSEKKVVLVTGSSRGIGKATIIEFAKKGYNVVINYNNSKEEAEKLENDVKEAYSANTLCIKADVSNEEEVKTMIDTIINKFGRLDVLVNNAGIDNPKPIEEKTLEEFRRVINTNLIGTFIVSKEASKYMLNQKSGKIINVASTNGYNFCSPLCMDYDASKAGIITLTHNFAMQLQPYVNVNAVAPGWVDTEMNRDLGENFYEEEKEKIYLKRIAKPEEIAKVIVFLASDDAAYINSEVIKIDGGF